MENKESELIALTIATRRTIQGKDDEITGMELITPQGRYMILEGRVIGFNPADEGYNIEKKFQEMLKTYARDIVSGKCNDSIIIEAHRR